jgi:putative hydrolase of the HAD superfamily
VCRELALSAADLDEQRLFQAYTDVCVAHWRAAEGSVVRSPSGSVSGVSIWREHWQTALAASGRHGVGLAELAVEAYTHARRSRYRLFDDVVDCLDVLRSRVQALALITNGPGDTQRHKIAAVGVGHYFDAIVISGEVGVAKPELTIFEMAARQVSVPLAGTWI